VHLNSPRTDTSVDEIVRATRSWYDREAGGYGERTSSYEPFPGLLDEISRFATGLAALSGPVLDLGCGTGRDTDFFQRNGLEVVAADLSTAMLLATTARCGRAGVRPVQLDMRQLPFGADVFRGVWICASLVHMPPAGIPGVLRELHRTVRTGGGQVAISMRNGNHRDKDTNATVWATEPNTNGRRWFTYVDPADFEELLREHGFVDCRSVSSGRANWFITYGRKS
jgi:SAM-dependent methyltransferase